MTARERMNEAAAEGAALRRERPQALRLFAMVFAVVVGLTILLGAMLSAAQAAGLFKFTQYKVPTANSAPSWITVGSDGNLWFTVGSEFFTPNDDPDTGGTFHTNIGRITPAGDITEFRLDGCSCTLTDIVQGPGGVLYFTTDDPGLGRITTEGDIQPFVVPRDEQGNPRFNANGTSIARHGDDIWYADFNNDSLWRYNVTSGNFTEFEVPNNPSDVAVAANGIVWYTANNPNAIGKLNPANGTITETPVPAAQPWQIAISTDGKVWYTERIADHIGRLDPSNNQLTRFPTLTPEAGPHGITAGPDGSMWFTQANTGNAARITPDGVITEEGSTSKDPAGTFENALGITMGPDGQSVWFAKPADNKIAALTPK